MESRALCYKSSYENNQQFQQYQGGIVNRTGGGRLVEYADKRYEVIPKDPAYVLGEQLLRPTIDTISTVGSHAWKWVKWSCSSLDKILSQAIHVFPSAEASQIPTLIGEQVPIIDVELSQKVVEEIWKALGINPEAVSQTLEYLASTDPHFIDHNQKLKEKGDEFNELINNFKKFILKNIQTTNVNSRYTQISTLPSSKKIVGVMVEVMEAFLAKFRTLKSEDPHPFEGLVQKYEVNLTLRQVSLNQEVLHFESSEDWQLTLFEYLKIELLYRGTHAMLNNVGGLKPLKEQLFGSFNLKSHYEERVYGKKIKLKPIVDGDALLSLLNIENPARISSQEVTHLLREEVMKDLNVFMDNLTFLINYRFEKFQYFLDFSEQWMSFYGYVYLTMLYEKCLQIAKINSHIKVETVRPGESCVSPPEWKIFFEEVMLAEFSVIGSACMIGQPNNLDSIDVI